MDFVAVKDGKCLCRLSGCSDVIHIGGIGGFNQTDWAERYQGVPSNIPPVGWSIDCLKKSGLLRLFTTEKLTVGMALSSFAIYSRIKVRKTV